MPPRLVRSDENLRSEQRDRSHVLDEVVVPADENRHPHTPGRVEYRVAISARDRIVLECVELAVNVHSPVREADGVGIVERVSVQLEEARPDARAPGPTRSP